MQTKYRLFRGIEIVVRKQLKISKLVGNSHSAKEILEKEIRSSKSVEKSWEILIYGNFSREESDDLFTTIMNYYIKIRLTSFVKLYVNLKKKENRQRNFLRRGKRVLEKSWRRNFQKSMRTYMYWNTCMPSLEPIILNKQSLKFPNFNVILILI